MTPLELAAAAAPFAGGSAGALPRASLEKLMRANPDIARTKENH